MKVMSCLTGHAPENHTPGMLECRQIRAARALLNWSQSDLAKASQMANSSIKNIENATTTARRDTLAQIRTAFESNGIEFLPASGVRLKTDVVTIVQGKGATQTLVDSIYATAHASPEREVCIIGMDESFSVQTDGLQIIADHIARLKQAGITEKILICEGDTHFLNDPDAYRWLPHEYFTRNAPLYIYGDKVAIHTGSLRRRTIIIEAPPLAQHLRKLFSLVWDRASMPAAHPAAQRAAAVGGQRR